MSKISSFKRRNAKTIQLVGWNRQQEKRDQSLKFAPKNLRSDEVEIKRFEIRAQQLTVLSFLLRWLSNRREPEWSIKGQFGVTSSVTTNKPTNTHISLKNLGVITFGNFGLSPYAMQPTRRH